MQEFMIFIQALVASSIFFVWVVRYDNIVEEFKLYEHSDGMRDLVGVLKLTFSLLLLIGIEYRALALVGGIGIALFMVAAMATHLRMKSPLVKMMPSLTLMVLSLLIAFLNYRILAGT
jgi:uncharacterized membrane protein YphA (DoxX/SURF4 family)